jgi:hypothetical protein
MMHLFMEKIAAYRLIAGHLYNLLLMNIGLVNTLLMTPSLRLSETAVRMDGHGKISVNFLIKPQELFLSGLVDPATEIFLGFVRLPYQAFRFTPSAVRPSHVVDFDLFGL